MTSTGTFQGMSANRNSSKVLKPPGGGSSDIFGSAEETSPRRIKNHNQSQLGSSFFGNGASTGSNSPDSPRANKPGNDSYTRLFGNAVINKKTITNDNTDGNPVTGSGYSDHQNNSVGSQNGSSASSVNGDRSTTDSSPASVNNKPRGRVPPGGFSSGLW